MTLIHFSYTDSYQNPSRGSLAFMPHRRHAANETEILPKPFTVPLINGETTVNLTPNPSSWVWIITEYFEDKAKSFYTTIPDKDGVIPHTELIHISPSSLPTAYDAVEPVWWAEVRKYRNALTTTLAESGEALGEAQKALNDGEKYVIQTRDNAALAKSYSEQSRQSSYDSRDYRDEAQQWRDEAEAQADRAASGPESAAARAENAANTAEIHRNNASQYAVEAMTSAAEARASETNAGIHAGTSTTKASEARDAAATATAEADRAQGYAEDLLSEPTDLVAQAQASAIQASQHASDASTSQLAAEKAAAEAQQHHNDIQDTINDFHQSSPVTATPMNGWTDTANKLHSRIRGGDLHIFGSISVGDRSAGTNIAAHNQQVQPFSNPNIIGFGGTDGISSARFLVNDTVIRLMSTAPSDLNVVHINALVPLN